MDAFERYWGGMPSVPRIEWRAEVHGDRRVSQLLDGEVDLVGGVGPVERSTLHVSGRAQIVDAATSVCVAFLCNLQSGPCQDRRVRQALNYGVDVDEIIETGTRRCRPPAERSVDAVALWP